ncbi:hypothetical protein MYAM1_000411 [Malassezia yamatoensis]|uniref:hydroxyethylthiazole kinase n=1 Tax=Malassezia yamatoensis TaxID=253288 RepID=A0AAJ6CEW5_9BASI|nr:hypothetical protein MYAM1_000411 [Malassezia yamatoensis]
MIINDNVEVALALPERVGLHVGQDDEDFSVVRERLGPNRVIGISVHNVDEARAALNTSADYAGVGPCWSTSSKAGIRKEDVLMLDGTREVVAALAAPQSETVGAHSRLPCVLIGGLNLHTAMRTLISSVSAQNAPDGIAVISAIVARKDPSNAAAELHAIIEAYHAECTRRRSSTATSILSATQALPTPFASSADLVNAAAELLKAYHTVYDRKTRSDDVTNVSITRPLVQTITSHVSSNFSANIALAFSASPIMSHEAEEALSLSKAIGALVLNIGTINQEARQGMAVAGPAANERGTPIVLDPVGVGATQFRREVTNDILNHTQVTLIKGNASEISALIGSTEVRAQGVDSVGTLSNPGELAAQLAVQEGAFVLLTGEVDYLTNGEIVIESRCGTMLLGRVTATGCSLGVVVAASLAAAKSSYNVNLGSVQVQRITPPRTHHCLLVGALMGVLAFTIAAERASLSPQVAGPGTFIPAFLDEIAALKPQTLQDYNDRVRVYKR